MTPMKETHLNHPFSLSLCVFENKNRVTNLWQELFPFEGYVRIEILNQIIDLLSWVICTIYTN